MTEQSRLSGGKPWVLRILSQPTTLVFTSPEAFEDIFKTQFDTFERGPDMRELFFAFFGKGIIGADGDAWLKHRRTASAMFTARTLRDVVDAVAKEKSLQMRDVLAEYAKQHKVVSMKSLLGKFSSDVFTKIGFGVDLNGLGGGVDEADHPFIGAVEVYDDVLGARLKSPTWYWKLKRFLNIGDERELKHASKIVHDLTHEVIRESLESKNRGDGQARKDLLALLVNSENDLEIIRDSAMNFLLAGKDTTGFSLSWIIVNMNRHPAVLAKLRAELHEKLPGLKTGEIEAPTFEALQHLPYLKAVVKESLRLFVSATNRVPNQSTTLRDGTYIPFGCGVMMPIYASSRMKSVWGEDADEYKPERWIDPETGKVKPVSPFKFCSFIGGPRICIGMRFALLQMRIATAVIFSRFDLKTVEDPFAITYDIAFTLPVKGPLDVTVHEIA
ncbi:Cytochrome P450 [Phytophthora megakarya]|uniref:Cytochrome P450 n=1 Tax=Phytophthora megakarya TaxID=4795 RepID=A0A225W1V4_9STRA|nr:Cytochrome P450 [Phytophthora megakarya]